jgi:hypothetical protein
MGSDGLTSLSPPSPDPACGSCSLPGNRDAAGFEGTGATLRPLPVLAPLGLVVLADVLRLNAAETLSAFGELGLRLKIVSGDNASLSPDEAPPPIPAPSDATTGKVRSGP